MEGADEVADCRFGVGVFGDFNDGEAEPFGVLFALADLDRADLDLLGCELVALDFDEVAGSGFGVEGQDVESGVVVVLLFGDSAERFLGLLDRGNSATITLCCVARCHRIDDTGEGVEQTARDDQGSSDDVGGLVDKIGFAVEFAKAALFAGVEVIGSLAGPAGGGSGFLAVEFLLFEFGGSGVPVADLTVESFFHCSADLGDTSLGDLGDIGEVRCGEVGDGPASGDGFDAGIGP